MRPHYESEIKAFWEQSFIGCCRVGVHPPKLGQLLQVNQHFATTLGYLTTELEGSHFDDITDFNSKGGLGEFQKVIAGELSHFEQDKLYRTKTDEKISAKVLSYPIYRNGADVPPHASDLLYAFSIIVFAEHNRTAEIVIRSLEARIKSNETRFNSLQAMVKVLMERPQLGVTINNENKDQHSNIENIEGQNVNVAGESINPARDHHERPKKEN